MGASGALTRSHLALAFGLSLLAGACGSDDELSSAASVDTRPAAECVDEDLDVATEPSTWRQDNFTQWFRDGCLVRVDVITDRPGPDHCGWGGTRVIAVGAPLGSRFISSEDTVQFVRDPADAYRVGLNEGFDARSTLPTGATFSGYRSATEELWVVSGDGQSIYVVNGDRVERWPAGEPPLCS